MRNITWLVVCCGIALTACDNTNESDKANEALMQYEPVAEAENSLLDKASSLASGAVDSAKDMASDAVESGKEMTEAAVESTSNVVDSAKETVTEAVDGTVTAAKEASSAVVEKTEEVVAAVSADDLKEGEALYKKSCVACHGTGAAGAPKLGDTAAWESRIAQGEELMTKNAITGFQGDTGYMPPKGGYMNLSDEEILLIVKYMVSQSL